MLNEDDNIAIAGHVSLQIVFTKKTIIGRLVFILDWNSRHAKCYCSASITICSQRS